MKPGTGARLYVTAPVNALVEGIYQQDRTTAEILARGDFGIGSIDELVANRLMKLAVTKETHQERTSGGTRILEIRTSPMPQGGIVTTYSDIAAAISSVAVVTSAVSFEISSNCLSAMLKVSLIC